MRPVFCKIASAVALPGTYGLNQSVSNPSVANHFEINATDGMTE